MGPGDTTWLCRHAREDAARCLGLRCCRSRKDAIVLPGAFICAEDDLRDQEFRSYCLQKFTEHKVLDFLFDEVKRVSQLWGKEGPVS